MGGGLVNAYPHYEDITVWKRITSTSESDSNIVETVSYKFEPSSIEGSSLGELYTPGIDGEGDYNVVLQPMALNLISNDANIQKVCYDLNNTGGLFFTIAIPLKEMENKISKSLSFNIRTYDKQNVNIDETVDTENMNTFAVILVASLTNENGEADTQTYQVNMIAETPGNYNGSIATDSISTANFVGLTLMFVAIQDRYVSLNDITFYDVSDAN